MSVRVSCSCRVHFLCVTRSIECTVTHDGTNGVKFLSPALHSHFRHITFSTLVEVYVLGQSADETNQDALRDTIDAAERPLREATAALV